MGETYNESNSTLGGQDAGNTDAITENAPDETTTDQGHGSGGPNVPGGVTGSDGREQIAEDAPGRPTGSPQI
jgi:hypothetical protein